MPNIIRLGGGSEYLTNIKAYSELGLIPAIGTLNAIAIITPVAIPSMNSGGIIFAPITQAPSVRTDGSAKQVGDMWFATGNAGNFSFTVVAGIKLYGVACFQWDGSAWTSRVAKFWNGSAWVDWEFFLYYRGNECSNVTGGWNTLGNAAKNADNIMTYTTGGTHGAVFTANKVDLSPYNAIKIVSQNFIPTYNDPVNFAISLLNDTIPHISDDTVFRQRPSDSGSIITDTFDISAVNGEYYVALVAYDGTPRGTRAYEIKCVA